MSSIALPHYNRASCAVKPNGPLETHKARSARRARTCAGRKIWKAMPFGGTLGFSKIDDVERNIAFLRSALDSGNLTELINNLNDAKLDEENG